jgi:NAD(P)-dependent dehydrogenase (short-subunit alcohol dehydrogenase family)
VDIVYDCLKGKTAIVTGASQGIGLAIARALEREGCNVFNFDIKEPEHYNSSISFLKCNVASEPEIEKGIASVIDRAGHLDILVNNAGIEKYNSAGEVPTEEWDEVIGVNLRGAFLMSKHSIPHLLKVQDGVIIYVASIQSTMVQKRDAAYVTSKHGLLGLARSIAVDYAPNIRTVSICPGTILTPLQYWCAQQEVGDDPKEVQKKLDEWGKMCPIGRQGSPEEVANVAVFMATKYASYVTGACVYVDGGLSAFIPESSPQLIKT